MLTVDESQTLQSAILRSAEIFGFHAVLLSKRGVPEVYPSVVKVSAGATEFLRISKEYSANQYAQAAREKAYRIVALDAKGDCDLRIAAAESAGQRLLLVIGGEDKSAALAYGARHLAAVGVAPGMRGGRLDLPHEHAEAEHVGRPGSLAGTPFKTFADSSRRPTPNKTAA